MFDPNLLVKHLLTVDVRGECHLISFKVVDLVVALEKDDAEDPELVSAYTYFVIANPFEGGYEKDGRDCIHMVVDLQVDVAEHTRV